MVEYTTATAKGGLRGCLDAVTDTDNAPTYAGIGLGVILGNIGSGIVEKLYTDRTETPNSIVKFVTRSAGRLGTSTLICALSGSATGDTKKVMESAAVGSSGMIAVDLTKSIVETYAPEQSGYFDLQSNGPSMVRTIRPRGTPTTLQVPPRVAMPAMTAPPTGGLVGGKNQQVETSGFVGGK